MSSKFLDLILPNEELYVPGTRDQFEVVAGGMPNGDASLRIGNGSSTGLYTARVPATSPGVYYSNTNHSGGLTNNTVMAILFWIKPHATIKFHTHFTGVATYPMFPLFSVHSADAVGPSASNNSDTDNPWTIFPWPDDSGGTYKIGIMENSNGSYGGCALTLTPGVWNLVHFRRTLTATSRIRWAGRRVSSAGSVNDTDGFQPSVNTGTARGSEPSRAFVIGAHENTALTGFRLADSSTAGFEIGKLAIRYNETTGGVGWTDSQLVSLYDAMFNGPPS